MKKLGLLGIPLLIICATSITHAQQHGVSDLTIAYAMKVTTGKKMVAAADGYDGSSKTVFVSGKRARIRLVSLMRMESIYFPGNAGTNSFATRVKESGKNPYKRLHTKEEWKKANHHYDSVSCVFFSDSVEILGYLCRKAVITVNEGEKITAYYTRDLPNLPENYDPAFNCLPGLVMQYEYSYKSAMVSCQAVSINRDPIDSKIFSIPASIPRKTR